MTAILRDIATALQTRLRAKGVPVPVVVGTESTGTTTGARERIVLEHDYDTREASGSARGPRPNPQHVKSGVLPFKVTIYAQSGKVGALLSEHEARALRIRMHVLVGLDRVCRGDLQIAWDWTGGGFVRPLDLEASAKLPGAVYQLTFTGEEAFSDVTWAGDGRAEAELTDGMIVNRTDVGLENAPEDAPVVTGCGGN